MTHYFENRSEMTAGYIRGYINALTNSLHRAEYYETTNDERFLNESNDWIRVANIYLKEILNEDCIEA